MSDMLLIYGMIFFAMIIFFISTMIFWKILKIKIRSALFLSGGLTFISSPIVPIVFILYYSSVIWQSFFSMIKSLFPIIMIGIVCCLIGLLIKKKST